MADGLLAALFASAMAGLETDSSPRVTDWPGFLTAAESHGLAPLANLLVQRSDAPAEAKQLFHDHVLGLAVRSARLRDALGSVLIALRHAGVDPIVLKGPALGESIYPDPLLRPFRDLDILCREADWTPVRQAMVGLGFLPLHWQPATPPPRVWSRKAHAHSEYYLPTRNILVEIHYDPWADDLRPRWGDRYWIRSAQRTIAGQPARILAVEDQILQTCIHLHRHGYERLIWFSDLARLLRQNGRIDWEYLVKVARDEGFAVSVYFSLHYLQHLLGISIPSPVLEKLRPGFIQTRVHQRFWPPDSPWQRRSGRDVSFIFREVPTGDEVLLNLLLGGRRWEKGQYLLRLLLPPTAWLARYYGTSDPSILRRRRIVHAPKLLARTVAEVFGHKWD